MKEAAGWKDQCLNKHSPTKNKATELVETVGLKVVMVITCSESFHYSYNNLYLLLLKWKCQWVGAWNES